MKFGLYVTPDTNRVIRCVDGKFEIIHMPLYSTLEKRFESILATRGTQVPEDVLMLKLQESGSLLTFSRALSKILYGVPDEVELYRYGDFGIGK